MESVRVSARISKRRHIKGLTKAKVPPPSSESTMVVNMYKYISDTWPTPEKPHPMNICKKTAKVLNMTIPKLCKILKKNGIDLTDDLKGRVQIKQEVEDENVGKTENIQQGKQQRKIYECSLCKSQYKNQLFLDRHTETHANLQQKESRAKNRLNVTAENHNVTGENHNVTGENQNVTSENHIATCGSQDQCEDRSDGSEGLWSYECPVCSLLYPSLNKATEHLHQFHRKYQVSSNPDSIKKVPVQQCPMCTKMVKSLLMHACLKEAPLGSSSMMLCMACEKKTFTLREFNLHALRVHGHTQEDLLFPSFTEFTEWKRYIEKASSVQYSMVEVFGKKKYYHCKHISKPGLQMCPSMMIAEEYKPGILVIYIKKHSCHGYLDYTPPPQYKKYCITKYFRSSTGSEIKIVDQHLQLKNLMENIVDNAAKINANGLQLLMEKALEMTTVLNNYEFGETEEHCEKKINMSDEQITVALQDTPNEGDDKLKPVMEPKIINTFSLADKDIETDTCSEDDIDTEILKSNQKVKRKTGHKRVLNNKQKEVKETKEVKSNEPENQINSTEANNKVTFNDTYKDFVTKHFVVRTDFPAKGKKEVMKTKIGHFNTIKSKSPNKDAVKVCKNKTESVNDVSEKNNKTVKRSYVRTPVNSKRPKKCIETPKYEDIKTELEPPDNNIEKNCKEDSRDSVISSPMSKIVDFEYEVIEQEAGYNILVLKF